MGQGESTWGTPPAAGLLRFLAVQRRVVALQVAFERQTLKPVYSLDRLQVMGLKGCRLWVMGQLDSNLQSPTASISAMCCCSNAKSRMSIARVRSTHPHKHERRLDTKTKYSHAIGAHVQGWPMGVIQSYTQPPAHGGGGEAAQDVALQVAFERQTLKPIVSLDRL
jgi:hypothetical protein